MKNRPNWYSAVWLLAMLAITGWDFSRYGYSNWNPWFDVGIILVLSPIIFRRRYTTTVGNATIESHSEAEAVRVADLLRKGVEPVETPVDPE